METDVLNAALAVVGAVKHLSQPSRDKAIMAARALLNSIQSPVEPRIKKEKTAPKFTIQSAPTGGRGRRFSEGAKRAHRVCLKLASSETGATPKTVAIAARCSIKIATRTIKNLLLVGKLQKVGTPKSRYIKYILPTPVES